MKLFRTQTLALIGAAIMVASCTSCSDNDKTLPEPGPNSGTTTSSVVPELDEVVMYEANPRLFGTSNCLKGVEARLDQIKALGTNVLWLMPIYEVGVEKSFGSPYCIKNYKAIEPKLGTVEDLKSLVKRAHELEIAVILDWVANHTSWDSNWITNKDWYTQDGAGNIISPAGTGWNDAADLNYDNAEMRRAMIDAMEYWVKVADIDGYRCDAADYVPADFWASAISQLRKSFPKKELLMLAEGGEESNFTAGFDMNYAWTYYDELEGVFKGKGADNIYKTHEREYTVIPNGKEKLRFTTNHDKTAYNGTPIQIYGGKQGSLSAFAIMTLMGGSPMIYSSQECAQEGALAFEKYYNYDWDADVEYTVKLKQIIDIRKNNKIFIEGRKQDHSTTNAVVLYLLKYPQEALLIANVRNSEQTIALPEVVVGKEFKNLISSESKNLPEELTLGAYEYMVWVK